jgi:hypothetical protein
MPAPSLTDQDVDEDIASDWNKILDGATADDLVADAEGRAAEGGTTGDPPDTDDDTGRQPTPPRDRRTGKFQPGTRQAEPTDDQNREPPAQQQRQAPPGQQQAPGEPPLTRTDGAPVDINKPPSSWRPTARAAWANLPEPVRAEIYKREGDYIRDRDQFRQDAETGRELGGILQPYRQLIEAERSTPQATMQDLLQTSAVLRTGSQQQKYQTMVNIANRFGIDLRDLAGRLAGARPGGQPGPQGQPNGQQPQAYRDPRVDQLLHSMQTQEQNRVQAETRAVENQALGWMNEADAQGNPLRPYAGDVVEDMVPLLPVIRAANPSWTHAQVMQDAYERAIWANPEIRKLLQEEAKKAAGATPADNLRRVNGARRAASVNVPRRGSTPAAGKPGTLEETITETARDLGLIN